LTNGSNFYFVFLRTIYHSFIQILNFSFRYDFVKKYIREAGANSVIDLGCAECKFVKELAMMDLRRVIGIDLDRTVLENGSNYFKPDFDDYYNPFYIRQEPVLVEVGCSFI
jgi:2-polyprenyl-3-methyl-5-hydroxy-6-metoxy-1,4-benzoquinol methylase